jgi:hypothetical protein
MSILSAFDIPHKGVLSVQIDCRPNELATISIIRSVDVTERDKLMAVLEQYAVERKPEDPAETAMEVVAHNLLKMHGGGSGG